VFLKDIFLLQINITRPTVSKSIVAGKLKSAVFCRWFSLAKKM
jgi:hypothetical protein